MPLPDARPKVAQDTKEKAGGPVFWKITGAGASFQTGSAAPNACRSFGSRRGETRREESRWQASQCRLGGPWQTNWRAGPNR
jgi:hypothetical protein